MPLVEEIPVALPVRSQGKRWQVGTLTYTTPALLILFGWLLWGDFAWAMKDRTVGPVLQLMLKQFSASDTLNGILLSSLPLAISMILGPIIAYKSDRHRGRWGRRIPFLLIPAPIVALAMIGLAMSPTLGVSLHELLGQHSPGLNVATLIWLCLFWIVYDFSTTIANSVFGALINDVVPQAVVGRFYGCFRATSLLAGIGFNYWLFGQAEEYYLWIFLGMGLLYGVGFSMMCLKVKEGDYPPPELANSSGGVIAFFAAARTYFGQCFGIPFYRWYYVAGAMAWMALAPFNLFNIFYAKSLDMNMTTYGECIALTFVISFFLAYPLGVLADRFHPLRVCLVVQFFYMVGMLCSGLLVTDVTSFAVALVVHGVLSGTFMTSAASLGQRLLPRPKFAQFNSAAGIVGCLGGIIVGPGVGLFLDHADHNYRYTFYMAFALEASALIAGLILYRKFVALGGSRNYVAPI